MFWVSLELNILSFLPLMSIEGDIALENSIKYFLIQRIASVFFLTATIIISLRPYGIIRAGTVLPILLKLGAAPMHGWFISLLRNSRARIIYYLSTTQKFIPLIIMTNLHIRRSLLNLTVLATMLAVCFNGVRALLLNKILGLSSINNLLWILLRSQVSSSLIIVFFCVYALSLLSVLHPSLKDGGLLTSSQTVRMPMHFKIMFSFFFINLGGLPPFLGFLAKALTLKRVIMEFSTILLIMLTLRSLTVLLYYIIFGMFSLTCTPSYKLTPGESEMRPLCAVFFIVLIIRPDLVFLGGL